MRRVTIQGKTGCFHETAVRSHFGGDQLKIVACTTFAAQFERMSHDRELPGRRKPKKQNKK